MSSRLPHSSTIEEARAWLCRYPYFTLPAIQALKGVEAQEDPQAATELAAHVAISLPSRESLAQTLSQQAELFDNFYPDEQKPTPGTIDTIDTFLATFGKVDERETDALSKLIFSPTPDYAAVLAAEERRSRPEIPTADDSSLSEQDRLINSFIAANQQPVRELKSDKQTNEPPTPEPSVKETESASLTESFVRILIKNRNYSKAIEIISDLSLKNPEKSIYFADQIRFLRKLIINENKK